jgi:hypothetical protein
MNRDSDPSHGEAFDAAQIERDRTLLAAREVEEALSRAAGAKNWVEDLSSSLEVLQEAMIEEQRELDRPASLLMMISAERPRRLGPRVRGIREQYDDISRQLDSFRRELDHSEGSLTEIGEIRHRADWILRALQNCRNRQADLVFDALGLDLGDADGQ